MTASSSLEPSVQSASSQDVQCTDDRQIVALVWMHIEQLLSCGAQAEAAIRQLTAALPDLDPVPNQELPALAHLHLDSAGQLMATVKLLVPEAFQENPAEPNMNAILAISGPAAHMLSVLIELQLFHLHRARDITAHMRARIAQKHANVQRRMQSMVTVSSGSGSLDNDLVQSLE